MKQGSILLEYMFAFAMMTAIILLVSYFTFQLARPQITEAISSQYEEKAFSISDILIKSKGSPENWEKGNEIIILGLAEEPYVLSQEKVHRFSLLKEEFIAQIFGTERFMVKIKGNKINIQKGMTPVEKNVAIVKRIALLNDDQIEVIVATW
ncbi:MAG: hypothetical protein QW331_01400 [Candidatus Woesearchaeota archaeon]